MIGDVLRNCSALVQEEAEAPALLTGGSQGLRNISSEYGLSRWIPEYKLSQYLCVGEHCNCSALAQDTAEAPALMARDLQDLHSLFPEYKLSRRIPEYELSRYVQVWSDTVTAPLSSGTRSGPRPFRQEAYKTYVMCCTAYPLRYHGFDRFGSAELRAS